MPHGENKHLNLKNKSNDELIFVMTNIITDKIAVVHPLSNFVGLKPPGGQCQGIKSDVCG